MARTIRNLVPQSRTGLLVAGISILIAMASLWVSLNITDLGRNIPQENLYWDYFLGLLWALALAVLLLILPLHERKHLLLIWMTKIFVVCFLMCFYEARYAILDSYSYFSYGIKGEIPAMFGSRIGGSANICRLTYALSFLTGNSYRALVIVYAFFGLLGIWLIYKAVAFYFQQHNIYLLYILALFPSVLFFSSVLGKEPLHFLFLGLYAYGVAGWLRKRNTTYLFLGFLGILFLTFLRIWWGIIAALPLLVVSLTTGSSRQKLISLSIGLLLILGAWVFLHKTLGIKSMNDLIAFINIWSRRWATGGSAQMPPNFSNIMDLVCFLPAGMFAALFRPLPWEGHHVFAILAGLENMLLLFLALKAAISMRLVFLRNPFFAWGLLLLLSWLFVYAFISYQNLGSAVRFKSGILPILLIVITLIILPKERNRLLAKNP